MSNNLLNLLATPVAERSDYAYERMCDDFVKYAGGIRISDEYEIPHGAYNADYLFKLNEREIILELKQVVKYDKGLSVNEYFIEEINNGNVKYFRQVEKDKIEITPDSLSKSEWNKFYKNFRPSVTTNLKKAANQLRDTNKFLPTSKRPRIKGVFILNSGDYNLPTDLLFRLIEWKMKREWKMGCFRSIDFVSCTTIDMYKENQNPLYGRHIVRTMENSELSAAAKFIYQKWIEYASTQLGSEILKGELKTNSSEDLEIDTNTPFLGKLTRNV